MGAKWNGLKKLAYRDMANTKERTSVERTIVYYRKDKEQECKEKLLFIDPLKVLIPRSVNNRDRPIKLPKYIAFCLDDENRLLLYIQEQPAINTEGETIKINATCCNMQTDDAAFEGWAVCLRAWFPEKIKTVSLRWDIPAVESQNPHYRRFLFRVRRFAELYDWFTVDATNLGEVENFIKSFNKLTINSSNIDPKQKSNLENHTEYDFVKKPALAERFKSYYGIDNFDHQLHMGIKKEHLQYFPGGQSAIDLWGRSENSITVIELKCGNNKVGIISELFLYVCVVIDLAKGNIETPSACKLEHERLLFTNIKSTTVFHAEMLADEYHPLLENRAVLDILNNNLSGKEGVQLMFGKTTFAYNSETQKLVLSCE